MLSHDIKSGENLLDIKNLKFSQEANLLIKNNMQEFEKRFGHAFIAGYTTGCSFDVKIDRKFDKNETKF